MLRHLPIVLLIASAVAQQCGVSTIKPNLDGGFKQKNMKTGEAITNSQPSVEFSWPWTAGICENDWFGVCHFKCTATVIGTRWALTTASCFTGDLKDWRVRAGMYEEMKKESEEQRIAIKAIYQHPSYSPSLKLDNIVIIETKDNFTFNNFVQPICLPSDDGNVLNSTQTGWITGWGHQKSKGGTISRTMEQALIDFDDDEVCTRTWSRKIYNSEFCAGEGDRTLCQYDEGVPIMVQSPKGTWYQHGSAAMIDGGCRLPGKIFAIFSKITYFCDWIHKTTNQEVQCIKRR